MKLTPARVRFVLETAFLIIVAAICWATHLTWTGIVPAMAVAWALVTLVERTASGGDAEGLRLPFRRHAPVEEEESAAPAESPAPEPDVPRREPEAEQPPTPIPEPAPEPGPAPEPVPPAPEPSPPRPEPTPQPDPNPQLRSVPEPEQRPEPEPEPEVERPSVAQLQPPNGAAREWNVWDLERLARESEGEDLDRDEELNFLLLELRQFANADGMLPTSFDPVVR